MFFKKLWTGFIGFLLGMVAFEITYYILQYNNRLDIIPWICVCTGCVIFLIILIWALIVKHRREKAHPKPKPEPVQQTQNFVAEEPAPAAQPASNKHSLFHKSQSEAETAVTPTAPQAEPMPEATNVQSAADFLSDADAAAAAKPVENSALADAGKDASVK